MERTESTLSKLRRLIAEGGIAADGRIPPERELASTLGVGRGSLRRALDVLEKEGRISRRQGRGTFLEAPGTGAIPFDRIMEHTNPLEVIELRLSLEPAIARLAALRASRCDIDRLGELAEATRQAAAPEEYERADAAFHRCLAEASRNALFLALYDTLSASQRQASWRRLSENAHCYKRQSLYARFHGDIAAAIAARDGDRAQTLMYEHLADVQRHIYAHAFPAAPAALIAAE